MQILPTARLALRTLTLDDGPFHRALVNPPDFITHSGEPKTGTVAGLRQCDCLDDAVRGVCTFKHDSGTMLFGISIL
jgi:hypothetical protein